MIESLTIQNFQSHANTEMEFTPGVNCIIGKTESGKSAIKRAIYLLGWNRPGGDKYRSTWGGKTLVSILTKEGDTISRIKDKGVNQYVLNDDVFNAFKTEVPEEISDALNMTDINLQSQFDNPFLLKNSAGEVAVHFNKIAHIDKIDISLKKIQADIRTIERKNESYAEQLTEINEELTKYDFLDKMEIEIEVVEELESKIQKQESKNNRLIGLVQTIESITELIEEFDIWIELETKVNFVLEKIENIEKATAELDKLSNLVDSIEILTEKIAKEDKMVELKNMIEPILNLFDTIETETKDQNKLILLVDKIITTEETIESIIDKTDKLQEIFNKNMPEVCPLCGNKTKIKQQ